MQADNAPPLLAQQVTPAPSPSAPPLLAQQVTTESTQGITMRTPPPDALDAAKPADGGLERFTVSLSLNDVQRGKLTALQALFAEACNSIAPLAAEARCWNRVGLHHLAYRSLRKQFPQLGSQMACNAIYSVSRAARHVYQDPRSKWNLALAHPAKLPRLRFPANTPVFFDRHTLSLYDGYVSLFTLDGRLKFHMRVPGEVALRFAKDKLREVVLFRDGEGFRLRFLFGNTRTARESRDDDPEHPEYLVQVEAQEGGGPAHPAEKVLA